MESGTCNNCNVEIYPTAIFCHKCGHRLKCEDCGAFLVKDANNCISCGKKINQENNPNTALKNTVTYRKTKDETFFDASLSDTVAKDGIGSLIANITNNRLPEGKFTNKEIEDLTDHIKKNDSDTLDIDSEEVVNEVNSKDGSNEFQHISDVEMNVNCSEAEWILIYAFYESEYATKRFTKKAVYDKYMSVRKTQSHINHFPENWKGLEWIEVIRKFIVAKKTMCVTYQSFKAREASTFCFSPYLLKEYRNRWFVLGLSHQRHAPLLTLALDRIQDITAHEDEYRENTTIDLATYYNDVLGVTKSPGQRDVEVVFWIDNKNAPYVITKPLHHTQKQLSEDADGIIFSIRVIPNFELERELLGFGSKLKVLGPRILVKQIKEQLRKTLENYSLHTHVITSE